MDFTLRRATARDLHEVASMAGCMWHSATIQELETEFSAMIQSEESAVFLAFSGQTVCGFAQCGLRRDYVEGTHTSPVGYLEGIYVKPECRSLGIGRQLYLKLENRAREFGCETVEVIAVSKSYHKLLHLYIDELGLEFFTAHLMKKL